ncbi:SCO2322 family protein [Streptomyces sp. NPDC086549]|uniref:SCO2322 family protein n=1 Tax=Streptomyces sp. NPDC086549 TaxID=3365752 RepID=UPI00382DC73D
MTVVRRAVPLLLAALFLWGSVGQAQAVGYRYWSFWERDGSKWIYATQGPSTARPGDGDVQGFRFAVSEDSADATRPRGTADFHSICAGTPAAAGKKRVALVIDFGTSSDAPSGESPPARRTACARVSPDATTAEALAAVAKPLRYDTNALLCAISGYPEKGCGEQVSAEKQGKAEKAEKKGDGKPKDSDHGPSVGLLAGAGVVVLLGAAALWQARRRA